MVFDHGYRLPYILSGCRHYASAQVLASVISPPDLCRRCPVLPHVRVPFSDTCSPNLASIIYLTCDHLRLPSLSLNGTFALTFCLRTTLSTDITHDVTFLYRTHLLTIHPAVCTTYTGVLRAHYVTLSLRCINIKQIKRIDLCAAFSVAISNCRDVILW
jgi:hypothetical protein